MFTKRMFTPLVVLENGSMMPHDQALNYLILLHFRSLFLEM